MDQTTERFLLVETIVTEALDVPEEQRADLIEARCQRDLTLADEVRLLLDACDAEEQLMASCRLEPSGVREEPPARKQVGPYEIDRLLGRGGMGAVYLAHRADGHFEQKVAIKLIDRPFETELFRERFRQERQILAGLQHPYIARLLDGGVTADGELYLTMEYVDGVPIHRFCQDRRLTQTQRIELFLRACEAVQFAHQNFVVHRDLKPDNILVVADGTPRLLDFGTAKLLSPSLEGQQSQLTREGYLSFTPQYASPEQVLGNPITTASDTYSLGVLLYLLLTGTLPYEFKELTTGEMLRAVCEEPPRRPSAAGSGKRLDSDLEAILLKALRKEPQERYLTAERMADDLRAYLEGLPVAARRGTLRYFAGKFVRRHRWALAAAAVLLVTLIVGITGIVWQASVANQERRKAEARSADLRQLSNSLLSELDDAIVQLPGSTKAQKLLVTRLLEHLDRMSKDAHGDRQTELELADAYTRLGNLQGNSSFQNIGDIPGALSSIDKAIALADSLTKNNTSDIEALRVLANAQLARSQIIFENAPVQEMLAAAQAATATYDRLLALPGVTPDDLSKAGGAYGTLGSFITEYLYDLPRSTAMYQKEIDLFKRALRIDPNFLKAKRGLAYAGFRIAENESETDPEQALKGLRICLQIIDSLPKEERETLRIIRLRQWTLREEANSMIEVGRYAEADAIDRDIVSTFQHQAAADQQNLQSSDDLRDSLSEEASIFETQAEPALGALPSDRRRALAEAEKLLLRSQPLVERLMKQEPTNTAHQLMNADVLVRLGSIQTLLHHGHAPAESVRRGLALFKEFAKGTQDSFLTLDLAANAYLTAEPASLRNPQLAVSYEERAVDLTHRKSPFFLLTLAQAYHATGQTEKSRAEAKEGLALLPAPKPGSVKPRIRKLLEIQPGSSL